MFEVGDQVIVEKTARIDIGFQSWSYVEQHPIGIIRSRMGSLDVDGHEKVLPEREQVYAVEFPDKFQGGTSCYGNTKIGQGQFITAKHLSLCFEASREVITVPQIGKEHEGSTEVKADC